jgi:hypothetical protein
MVPFAIVAERHLAICMGRGVQGASTRLSYEVPHQSGDLLVIEPAGQCHRTRG